MKRFVFLLVGLFMGLMIYAEMDLPQRGDPNSPASLHVAARYIEHAEEDTHTPNVVTAVLADYRSFDTLGEAGVVFTAALCCIVILMKGARDEQET